MLFWDLIYGAIVFSVIVLAIFLLESAYYGAWAF